uniref:Protein prenyltransferase alpha subunit repeat-containing protein 1 n=1 Tax=Timema monikensis TaxID=170555 RepID=A0A7R9DZL1_9NEOP|nr:unnamed protein product [Timema monikensis]
MEDEGFPAAERILSDIEAVFKKDPYLKEFDIIPVTENQNKSPVLHVEHSLGLESWCVRHVYCHAYHRLMNIRQHRSKREDPATLSRLLCSTLLLNPDISTFWGMRRELVQSGTLSGRSELHYTAVLLSRKPKCSEAFAHHSIDVNELLEEELRVSQYAADRYPNNYYAWSHRMWCVSHLVASTSEHKQVLKNEWAASERWVSTHVSDHSGLQYRQFLLKTLFKCLGSNSLTTAAPIQDTKQFLMQFLVSPDTNGCIVHKDEGEKSTSKLLVFLTSDLFLNTDLILRFVGHEALWYHRRFLLTTVKDLVGCGIANRNECSSEKSILEHENGEEDCENNGSLLHNGSNNIHLSNEGIPLEKDQKLSSIEILHDSNLDNLLRMTLLDQEQTLIAKCLPEDIHQYRLLALPSASLKPILWDGGREGEKHGVASQLTKVSFRANKNRWITEIVDGASYRTANALVVLSPTAEDGEIEVRISVGSIFTGLIVTASQGSDSLYNYNTVTVVLFTEILKLMVSTALYYKE